ncbi:MAG: cytochrome c biogenesis CcdA family protein, partial [Spirochaetota bacterium]
MTAAPGFGLAFAAGLLSFLSPCILPLIPSYLSYIGGASLAELQQSLPRRSETVGRTLLFVLGFSVVFVVLGLLAGTSGFLIGGTSRIIGLVAGGIVVLLGLNIIFDFWKTLNIERKFHFSSKPRGYAGSVAIGMAFGAGWTPCIGPILAGILFLAGRSGNAATGTALLLVYSLGLGVPFLIAGAFFPQFLKALSGLKRHLETIRIVSGAFLVGIGLL